MRIPRDSRQIRVRRVIVVEGYEPWVTSTLEKSLVDTRRQYLAAYGSITEVDREVEVIPADQHVTYPVKPEEEPEGPEESEVTL